MPVPDSVKFNNGDIVKRVTNDDESGVIVGIVYRPAGNVEYFVMWPSCTEETIHRDVELVMEKEFVDRKK